MHQVNIPITAVRRSLKPNQESFFIIPIGSILRLIGGGQPDHSGLVDVKVDDESLAVFECDLKERSSLISSA
jgi:hypothetical protein